MKHVLLTVFAIVQLAVTAQAGYAEKLKAVQEIVAVEFSPIMSDVQKVQAINRLYTYLTSTPNKDLYGTDKLVRKIYINSPDKYTSPVRDAANAKLRDHSLVMSFDGRSIETFETNANQEITTLNQINQLTVSLKNRFPKLTVNREADSFSVPGTNQSHLELLTYINDVLPTVVNAELEGQLETITITDATRGYNHCTATLGNSFYGKNKKFLSIEVGHTGFENDSLVLNRAGFSTLVSTVTTKGFVQINLNLVDATAINQTLTDFNLYLTSEVEQLLKTNKVTYLTFKENVDTAQDLFKGGTLTLGISLEKMNFVTDLLFR